MKRFGRFIILAIVGFGVGALLAYYQAVERAPDLPAATTTIVEKTTDSSVVSPTVAEQQTAGTTTEGPLSVPENTAEIINGGAAPVVAPIEETATQTADEAVVAESAAPAEKAAPEAVAAPAVAGSSVGGAFSLTDHNGQAVTDKSWPGKLKLVFFGFTHCPDICPTTLDKLTTALNTLGADADKIQPLFITTDGARDTADVMKAYVAGYHPSIVGLTGTEEQLKAAQDAYKVYAAKVPGAVEGEYSMNHSSYVFLMTADDQLDLIFKGDDTAEAIAEKLKARLSGEAP